MLLHVALRQLYNSIPAISKIYWKDSVNSTVKGFDAVHVVEANNKLELWLGEVKFYEDAAKAMRDVVSELEAHTGKDYLKNEFTLITNKLDHQATYHKKLVKLLDPNTSLDEVFDAVCIPVLLTYNSESVRASIKSDPKYLAAIRSESMAILKKFSELVGKLKTPVKLHLFLVPLHTKSDLVRLLDKRLKELQ